MFGQHHAHLLLHAVVVAQAQGEVVGGAGLEADAVEAAVLNAEAGPAVVVIIMAHALRVETHVGGATEAAVHRLDVAQRMAVAHGLPRRTGAPAVTLVGAIFEGSVLHEFGVKTAVGSVTDVLEENADELITDGLAAGRDLIRLRSTRRGGNKQEKKNNDVVALHNYL